MANEVPIVPIAGVGLTLGTVKGSDVYPAVDTTDTTQNATGTTKRYLLSNLNQYMFLQLGINAHAACIVATTANLTGTYLNGAAGVGATITYTSSGVQSIDGHQLVLGDRVLVKNQTTPAQNGIYSVTVAPAVGINGVLTRTIDANTSANLLNGDTVLVTQGSTNANKTFQVSFSGSITFGVTSLTWTLFVYITFPISIAHGGTGVTSVTTSPTVSAFAGWDANSNLSANNFLSGYATTATAAATTTLLVGSAEQQYFTGSTTQTVLLPVTSTLVLGQSFYIVNNSSGIVTVQSSGANTIKAMGANSALLVTCILTSGTSAASWNFEYSLQAPSSSPWTFGVGTGSAIGGDGTATAAGNYAGAYGSNGTTATMANAFAWGDNAQATNAASFALGNNTVASGLSSVAMMSGATASGSLSLAIGLSAEAHGTGGVAIGFQTISTNTGSFVFGDSTSSGITDASFNQFVTAFTGGYFAYVGTTLATHIDGSFNFINLKGRADQSASYQTPSTGFSITIGAGVRTLALTPAGTLATGTIVMPAAPIQGQEIYVSSTQTITALTVSPGGGQTISNPPTTLLAGQGFGFIYNLSTTNWLPKYQSTSSSSPWMAGAGTGTAVGGDGSATATGNYSICYGDTSPSGASGTNQFVFGHASTAIGNGSVSIGRSCNSIGGYSYAFGFQCNANGVSSYAFGLSATATNQGSFVFSDSTGAGNTDSGVDQSVNTFSGGYYNYVGATLAHKISTAGVVTAPVQPSFDAYVTTTSGAVTGDNTDYLITSFTEVYDTASNFNDTTGVFTAPVDGVYYFYATVLAGSVGVLNTNGSFFFLASGGIVKYISISSWALLRNSANQLAINGSINIKMTAGDTLSLHAQEANNGSKNVTIIGGAGTTIFGGYLLG